MQLYVKNAILGFLIIFLLYPGLIINYFCNALAYDGRYTCFFPLIFVCWWSVHFLARFLVGEGARTWAKSKGISSPGGPKDADEVSACYLTLLNKGILRCLFSVLFLHLVQQWLVTEKAKIQWKKYKAMLHDAKAASDVFRPPCSPQEATSISGTSSDFKCRKK